MRTYTQERTKLKVVIGTSVLCVALAYGYAHLLTNETRMIVGAACPWYLYGLAPSLDTNACSSNTNGSSNAMCVCVCVYEFELSRTLVHVCDMHAPPGVCECVRVFVCMESAQCT